MAAPQMGSELAAARVAELRRAADRYRTRRIASAGGRRVVTAPPRSVVGRPARWIARVVLASLHI